MVTWMKFIEGRNDDIEVSLRVSKRKSKTFFPRLEPFYKYFTKITK